MTTPAAVRDSLSGLLTSFADEFSADADAAGLSYDLKHQLSEAIDAGKKAVAVSSAAEARISELQADKRMDKTYIANEVAKIRAQAQAEAEAHIETASSTFDRLSNHVTQSMRPAKPAGVDQAEVLDRKADLQKRLGEGPTVGARAEQLYTQAAQAIKDPNATLGQKEDARLTAYVLSGGPLDQHYATHDPNASLLLAQHLGTAEKREFVRRRIKGAAANGRNFKGYVDVTRHIIDLQHRKG